MKNEKLLIVPRTPENAYFEFERHGYYENFYKNISNHFKTTVLTTHYNKKTTKQNLSFTPIKTGGKIKEAISLIKTIYREKPDTVMTENASLTTITAFTAAKAIGAKTVMKIEALPRSTVKTLVSSTLADGVSSVAECVDKQLPTKSEVVHPGTNFPDKIQEHQLGEGKPKVGFLGRFHPDKGIDRFIEIVENTPQGSDTEFHVAGRGQYKKQELIELDQKRDDFTFHGKIPSNKIFPFLAALDLLVVPSRIEGCTRVVVEALYSHTPVLAWDIEPHREMIENRDMLVNSVEETVNLIESGSFCKTISWFEHSKYTVESEITGMKNTIENTTRKSLLKQIYKISANILR